MKCLIMENQTLKGSEREIGIQPGKIDAILGRGTAGIPDSKLADELSLFSIHLILIELSPQDTAKTWKTWTPTLLVRIRIGVGLTENLWKRQLRR